MLFNQWTKSDVSTPAYILYMSLSSSVIVIQIFFKRAASSEETHSVSDIGQKMISEEKESGVDMAFDALLDLEENSDLSNFMKNFTNNNSDDPCDIWRILDDNSYETNKATQDVLRYEFYVYTKHIFDVNKNYTH